MSPNYFRAHLIFPVCITRKYDIAPSSSAKADSKELQLSQSKQIL